MKILCVGFTKTHVDICRLNNPKSPNIHMKASYLHLEFGRPPSEANNEAPRPEIHRYSAAEAPCRTRFVSPAMPPPSGASPPPRGPCQLPGGTESSLGQPMRQRHFSLNVEERVTTETRWDRTKFTRRSQCQETGDLLRQGREKCTGFQGWFAWKVS